jgi:hypothetical protein
MVKMSAQRIIDEFDDVGRVRMVRDKLHSI